MALRIAKADGGAATTPDTPPNDLGLYSGAAAAARALPQNKGTPQQMLASLKGVKPDELKWSGAQQAFAGSPQRHQGRIGAALRAEFAEVDREGSIRRRKVQPVFDDGQRAIESEKLRHELPGEVADVAGESLFRNFI